MSRSHHRRRIDLPLNPGECDMTNIEGTKSRQLTTDDIALMVRELGVVTLPHKDPGDVPEWVRRNGNITLAVQPGYKDDPQ